MYIWKRSRAQYSNCPLRKDKGDSKKSLFPVSHLPSSLKSPALRIIKRKSQSLLLYWPKWTCSINLFVFARINQ